MEYTEIQTNADSLDNSVIFHVIKDVIGFVLFMHQQIPSVLQDIGLEFDTLKEEYHELGMALAQAEANAYVRRKHMGRMREVKGGIRRLEKLMNSVSALESALQLMISEIPRLESFILVLGASPIRPQHVYELCFSRGKTVLRDASDFTKSRAAEGLSRKAIRALIAKGAGSDSHPGPTKLFLLVKAPSSFNLPLHFLPKRNFRYSKKIMPVILQVKCKSQNLEMDVPDCACQSISSVNSRDSTSNEFMWFQCRHVVKGLAFAAPTEE
ncbi:hypothetical protein P3X46_003073 [Hevea brasiliensis]|uniref:SWIM-type domain-containing protein n=1 Tax=Hevea brasiliensis TaxID=3981 RepID=A0ABQ9N9Y7_HEVBR|nr:uncharacterized protein LOC110644594 isoform X2 [Hevea brasiliensis]XP_057994280.1 uncharacterized protein LOC110644594 isoform X2 [Hevea brasiliensis]KAJ9187644.1 hypothetical protein P3X46_003073 [Hevea brasiliensis]